MWRHRWRSPIVTVCITFLTLVFSELAPKRLALQRTVRIALFAAPTLDVIARLARPVVWLLSVSVNVVVRLLGADPRQGRQAMTEQEVRELLAGTQTLSADERRIVGEVFDAGKRQIREVLRPRTEVEFLAAGTTVGEAARIASSVPYSRLPVYQGSYDNVVGFVHIRDLLGPAAPDKATLVDQVVRPIKFLPISKTVLSALSEMRRERAHLAIVVDEYGGTAGIVTLEDLVEELIGDIRDEYDFGEAPATKLPQGRGRGGRPAQPGRVRRADLDQAAGRPLRDRRRATCSPHSANSRRRATRSRFPGTRSRSPRWTAAVSPASSSHRSLSRYQSRPRNRRRPGAAPRRAPPGAAGVTRGRAMRRGPLALTWLPVTGDGRRTGRERSSGSRRSRSSRGRTALPGRRQGSAGSSRTGWRGSARRSAPGSGSRSAR